jgi:hypothetical protein
MAKASQAVGQRKAKTALAGRRSRRAENDPVPGGAVKARKPPRAGKTVGPEYPTARCTSVEEQAAALRTGLSNEINPEKARKVLEALTQDRQMNTVWAELRRCKRPPGQGYMNPALLGQQEEAIAEFFFHVYRAALNEPVSASEFRKARKVWAVANEIFRLSSRLEVLGINLRDNYADKLRDIAVACAGDAILLQPNPMIDPGLSLRVSKDILARAFVSRVAASAVALFGKELYSTTATLANVVSQALAWGRTDYSGEAIREILRSSSKRKLPSDWPDDELGRFVEKSLEGAVKKYHSAG